MTARPAIWKVGTAVAAVALAASACSSSGSGAKSTGSAKASGGSSSMSMPMTDTPASSGAAAAGTDATATPAAALRAGLDELFREHVNLTGFAVQTAVGSGLGSAQTTAALKALDDNTVAIGQAIGSVYGASAQTAFLKMWRAHIGFFVSYTKGLATNDQALVKTAQTQLAGYRKDFSTFLGSATGLPAAAISADLQGHVQTLETAIQAIVKKDPSAAAKVSMAESHMAGTGAVLAKGIAAQKHLT